MADVIDFEEYLRGKDLPLPDGFFVYECVCGSYKFCIAKANEDSVPSIVCVSCGEEKTEWFE